MAKSQNGWPAAYKVGNTVYDTPPLTKLSWITGSVRSGDVWTVLNEVAKRFNNEVEKINPAHSWGFAPRPIRGSSTTLSNHASGTAVDFNAPAHPLGKSNTFSVAQRAAIRRILKDLDGVVRWGGDYTGRKDEMHFEVVGSAASVKKVADKIRNNTGIAPPQKKDWLDMVTEAELRKIMRQEMWGYRNDAVNPGQDAYSILTKIGNNMQVRRNGKTVALAQEVADTKTHVLALEEAVKALAENQGLDAAAVLTAVEERVAKALRENTVSVDIKVDAPGGSA